MDQGRATAKYLAICPLCEEEIGVGNPIIFVEDEEAWAHHVCPCDRLKVRTPEEMDMRVTEIRFKSDGELQ
jgi:hypothetical protein